VTLLDVLALSFEDADHHVTRAKDGLEGACSLRVV
jgi:hypothetical protein